MSDWNKVQVSVAFISTCLIVINFRAYETLRFNAAYTRTIMSLFDKVLRTETCLFKIYSILSSDLCTSLPRGLFPVGLPVKILKALLHSSILSCHFNFLNLIDLNKLGQRYKLIVRPSLLPIFISIGPKYSPLDTVFKSS